VGRVILLVQFGDVGDMVLTIPAIRSIRHRYPAAHLLLLAKENPGRLVTRLGLVDELLATDKHAFDRLSSLLRPAGIARASNLLRTLRRRGIDTAVVFHHLVTRWGSLKFAVLTLSTGAAHRVGVDNGRGWFLTQAVPDRGFGDRHESEYWMDVAALLDARSDLRLDFPLTSEDRAAASVLLTPAGRDLPVIAIHPGTGWYGPGRRWPAERFAQAASLISEHRRATFVVVGTDEDRSEARVVLDRLPSAVDLVGRTTLPQLGAVLQRCDLLLANDGGVAHVAAAVGTRVVAVFGPSNDRAWRPTGARVVAVDLPCRPCFYRDFERGKPAGCGTRECLTAVSPRMVADAALEVLGGQPVVA